MLRFFHFPLRKSTVAGREYPLGKDAPELSPLFLELAVGEATQTQHGRLSETFEDAAYRLKSSQK